MPVASAAVRYTVSWPTGKRAGGSGAGCAAAYLRRHGQIPDGEAATLRQGRFTGRPSEILLRAHGAGSDIRSVEVGGDVALVGEGRLDVLPE